MKYAVETRLGPVWLWGRLTGKPVLLIITGAYANAEYMAGNENTWPDVDVLLCHLPGNHCPELVTHSVGAYAAAYSEALASLTREPVVVLGVSAGALVALALKHPSLRAIVAVEPPLRTGELWPLAQRMEGDQSEFVWNLFGMGRERTEPRDYTHLLQRLPCPLFSLVGQEPLMPPGPFVEMPSLVDEPSRAALRAAGRLLVAKDAGHNVPYQNGRALIEVVKLALEAATTDQAPLARERA